MVIIVIKTLCYTLFDLCFLSIGRGGKVTRKLFYQRIHLRGELACSEEYKQVVLVSCLLVGLSKVGRKVFQYGAIFRFVCFLSCPFGKLLFRLALKFSGLVSGKRIDHSLAIFPVVSQARISRGILKTFHKMILEYNARWLFGDLPEKPTAETNKNKTVVRITEIE